jgi:hypothetical protein
MQTIMQFWHPHWKRVEEDSRMNTFDRGFLELGRRFGWGSR